METAHPIVRPAAPGTFITRAATGGLALQSAMDAPGANAPEARGDGSAAVLPHGGALIVGPGMTGRTRNERVTLDLSRHS